MTIISLATSLAPLQACVPVALLFQALVASRSLRSLPCPPRASRYRLFAFAFVLMTQPAVTAAVNVPLFAETSQRTAVGVVSASPAVPKAAEAVRPHACHSRYYR
jgi:hypothetical protein